MLMGCKWFSRHAVWLLLTIFVVTAWHPNTNFVCDSFAYNVSPVVFRRQSLSKTTQAEFTNLKMASGLGMGSTGTKNRKSKNKKARKKNALSSSSSSPFDAKASLLRLEKRYDALCLTDAKKQQRDTEDDFQRQGMETSVLSEYVIGVRVAPSSSIEVRSVSDWIPVAQLCISRPMSHVDTTEQNEGTSAGVSFYCRELSYAASLGIPVLKTVAREQIEYSAEPVSSFHKHVYDPIVGGTNEDGTNDAVMTKAEARSALQLEANVNDLSLIKQSYRNLSFELHPDRLLDKDLNEQELANLSNQYAQVKLAYETLISGGIRNGDSSWYQSLGGRARTDFYGPIPLMSRDLAHSWMKNNKAEIAVVGLDPEITTPFLLRNQAVV